MTEKKKREKVVAEITLTHLTEFAEGLGLRMSHEEAIAFLNQNGRAYDMWKHMMHAAEDFIACSLLRHSLSPGGHHGFASQARQVRCDHSAMPRSSVLSCSLRHVQELCRQREMQNRASQRCV